MGDKLTFKVPVVAADGDNLLTINLLNVLTDGVEAKAPQDLIVSLHCKGNLCEAEYEWSQLDIDRRYNRIAIKPKMGITNNTVAVDALEISVHSGDEPAPEPITFNPFIKADKIEAAQGFGKGMTVSRDAQTMFAARFDTNTKKTIISVYHRANDNWVKGQEFSGPDNDFYYGMEEIYSTDHTLKRQQLACSADGHTVAYSGNGEAGVSIYHLNSSGKYELQKHIDGTGRTGDIGHGVSMSDDGLILATQSDQTQYHVYTRTSEDSTKWYEKIKESADANCAFHESFNMDGHAISPDGYTVALRVCRDSHYDLEFYTPSDYGPYQWVKRSTLKGDAIADLHEQVINYNGTKMAVASTFNDGQGSLGVEVYHLDNGVIGELEQRIALGSYDDALITGIAFNQYNGHEQLAATVRTGLDKEEIKLFENNNGWTAVNTITPLSGSSHGVMGGITDVFAMKADGTLSLDAFGGDIAFAADELLVSVPFEDSGDKTSVADDSTLDSGAIEVFKLGQ